MRLISSRIVARVAGIERRQRLVEQQRMRIEDQCAAEGDALLLAAGELRRQAFAEAGEADLVEHRVGALAPLLRRDAAHAQRIGDVLPHAHVRKERVALEHDAAFARARRQRADVLAVEADGAGIGREEAGNQPQQRRLAAAGGPDADDEFAGGDAQREIVHTGLGAGIAIAHAFEGDGRLAPRSCSRRRHPRGAAGHRAARDGGRQRQQQQHDRGRAGESGGAVERLQQHDGIGAIQESRDQVGELEFAERQRRDDDEARRGSNAEAPAARCA